MFVNRYQINLSTINTGSTNTHIDIPINMEFQIVDQSELIDRVFVTSEVEKNINPILDYEKARFLPTDLIGYPVNKITYNLNLNGATNYAAIGFTDDDIKFEKNTFKQSFLNLSFYDTDNPLNQKLIANVTIFAELKSTDLLPLNTTSGMPGQPKPANQIPLTFIVENPLLNPLGFSEGFNLYDYKDELGLNTFKYLYMRASFKNAKTGKSTNLMVENTPDTIDNLVHKLYTRYRLYRNNYGFYYHIDSSYHGNGTIGPNNVSYLSNNAVVNLYDIKAL